MADTDAIVIEALLDDVLDQDILQAAVDRALQLCAVAIDEPRVRDSKNIAANLETGIRAHSRRA